ncbi:MAG: PAS domain S-box protein, partial [Lentisphaerae bacterium]|nr:PAS domain S-box protein [Lentisphaerota bacterium]
AADGEEGLAAFEANDIDVVVTDIILPHRDGIELLRAVHQSAPRVPVIVMTGEPSLDTAAAAVREKAFDYLPKPITGEALVRVVGMAVLEKEREDEFERLRAQEERRKEGLERLVADRTAALRESRYELTEAQRIAHVGNWRWDVRRNDITASDEMRRMWGVEEGVNALAFRVVLRIIHPADRRRVSLALEASVREDAPFDMEFRIVLRTGEERVIHACGEVQRDEGGQAVFMRGIGHDITERRRADADLRDSRAFLDNIIEQSPYPMWIADARGTLIRLNKACEDLLGVTAEEVVGKYNILADSIVEEQGHMPAVRAVFSEGTTARFTIEYDSSRLNCISLVQTASVVLDVTVFAIRDTNGNVTNAAIQHIDVTAREQALDRLRDSESRFRGIVQNTDAGYFFIDKDGIIRDVNAAWLGLYALSGADEVVGKHFDTIQTSDDVGRAREFVAAIMRGDEDYLSGAFSRQRTDGTVGYHTYVAHPVTEAGEVTGIEGFIIDSTERVQAEGEARLLGTVAEQASDSILVTDTDFHIVYANRAAQELFGYGKCELLGKTPDVFNADPAGDAIQQELYAAVSRGKSYTGTRLNRRKDGSTFICEFRVTPVRDDGGHVQWYVGVQRDVTERTRTEGALREARREWEDIFQAIGQPAFILDPEHHVLQANRAALDLLGKSLDDVLGEKCCELFYGSDLPPAGCPMEALSPSGPLVAREMEMEALERTFLVSCTPILDDAGELIRLIHINTDITDRKESEQALKRSEAMLRGVFEAAPVGIGVVTNRVLNWGNERLAKMTGYGVDEFPGMDSRQMYLSDEEHRRVGDVKYAQIQEHGVGEVRTQFRRKDGTAVDVLLSSAPIDPGNLGAGVVFTALDITEQE